VAENVAEFIEVTDPADRVREVCRRAAACYEQGLTVAVYCPDPDTAAEIDSVLWTFRQDAFVPHVRQELAEEPAIEPVVIFGAEPGEPDADVLVVVAGAETPDWFGRFPHVYDLAEVYDESLREASRTRYSAYQKAGYRMRFIR
jgi:DNA polymerase-3 subunit chi